MNSVTPADLLQSVAGPCLDSPNFSLESLLSSLSGIGGQASTLGQARSLFQEILRLRSSLKPEERPLVFLGYTSNMMSSGLREAIKYLCEERMVDAIVTTGGGVEEDFMKCMRDTYVNYEYTVNDRQWRIEGKNRIGNMVVPNDNYVVFEEWFSLQYDQMVKEQKEKGTIFGPSDIIRYLGERIDNPESVYHWCAKNDIPVFCPGITDGSLGDILYCKGFSDDHFIVDVNKDLQKIMTLGLHRGRPLAAMLFGGGIVKYHILNACKIAGGLDMGIFISVGNEFDNSCSGAKPSQDVTRQAIRPGARIVNLNYDASVVVPLILANNGQPKKQTETEGKKPESK